MRWALVTGASSGIGLNISLELARKGYSIILVGRDQKALDDLANKLKRDYSVGTEVIAADLCEDENIKLVHSTLYKYWDNLVILVNNAGLGAWGRFAEEPLENQLKILKLNNIALIQLTHFVLEIFLRNNKGYILNIGSSASFQAVPGMAVYSASKAFVHHFSRALALELKGSGVSVTCVHPGATETAFVKRAGMSGSHLEKQAEKFNMKPDEVASLAVNAMFKRKVNYTTGFLNQLNYSLSVLLPDRLLETVAARLYLRGK